MDRVSLADVEVGVFLSGGIDSSLITAIARRQFDAPMRTYSIGFDSPAVDETGAAERMALLKYDVEDLRLFYENDLRFNRQF